MSCQAEYLRVILTGIKQRELLLAGETVISKRPKQSNEMITLSIYMKFYALEKFRSENIHEYFRFTLQRWWE